MPEMDADLIGAASQWAGDKKGGAVGIAREHAELGVGLEASFIPHTMSSPATRP